MIIEKMNIRGISEKEYSETAKFFPETAERIKNCRPDDKKRTLAGRLLLKKMIKEKTFGDKTEMIYQTGGLQIEYDKK